MNQHDIDAMALQHDIAKILKRTPSTCEREIVVTVSRAAYGKPSMALIEWTGSPPWFSTALHVNTEHDEFHDYDLICIDKAVKGDKARRIQNLCYRFLAKHGYLDS